MALEPGDRSASNAGKWDAWYAQVTKPQPYGDVETYRLAAAFLSSCQRIEDWGCGTAFFRAFVGSSDYVGIDGSRSPFADVQADLTNYRSRADGILLRHVLEHDHRWELILANAVASFREKLCIVVFTPLQPSTRVLAQAPIGVPDIGFSLEELLAHLPARATRVEQIDTASFYGCETLLYVSRPAPAATSE